MNEAMMRIIGLATRAGKIEVGEGKTEDRVSHNKSKLVIISLDASENTVKKFEKLCNRNGVKMIRAGERDILGKYTGRESAVVLTVSDEGFANRIKELAKDIKNI
ncbi:MAG: hypothetical protein E7415_00550 [Ruminococcaceae bacterium]|nr:hypothetical protein [Oscillospiraceae bacterium]